MSTKYRLIKKYPGSQEIGTIYTRDACRHKYEMNSKIWYTTIPLDLFPEFFEEVKDTILTADGFCVSFDEEVHWCINGSGGWYHAYLEDYPYIKPKSPDKYRIFKYKSAALDFIMEQNMLSQKVLSLNDVEAHVSDPSYKELKVIAKTYLKQNHDIYYKQ